MNISYKVLLIILIIGVSKAAFLSRHADLFSDSESVILHKSSLGRALISLISLYSDDDKLGMQDLFDALDRLK